MAKVIMTIEDSGAGIRLKIESDPAFPGPAKKVQNYTNAQYLGMLAMKAVSEEIGGDDGDDDDEGPL